MEPAIGAERVDLLRRTKGPACRAMNASEEAGRSFSRDWGALAEQIARLNRKFSATLGRLPAEEDPRTAEVEKQWSGLRGAPAHNDGRICKGFPGALRPFFKSRPSPDSNRSAP